MEQVALGAAGVRRVGYGLEAGHIVSPRAQLVTDHTSFSVTAYIAFVVVFALVYTKQAVGGRPPRYAPAQACQW